MSELTHPPISLFWELQLQETATLFRNQTVLGGLEQWWRQWVWFLALPGRKGCLRAEFRAERKREIEKKDKAIKEIWKGPMPPHYPFTNTMFDFSACQDLSVFRHHFSVMIIMYICFFCSFFTSYYVVTLSHIATPLIFIFVILFNYTPCMKNTFNCTLI